VLIIALLLIAMSVGAAVLFLMELAPSRTATVTRRLEEVQAGGNVATPDVIRRRRRQEQAERLTAIIQALGEKVEVGHRDTSALRMRLIQAGYPNASAVPLYLGARIGLPMTLGGSLALLLPALGQSWMVSVLMGVWAALIGFVLPTFIVRSRIARRQKQMQKALPDALDLLVVCVEAGLGLTAAIQRVSDELRFSHPDLGTEFARVTAEMRAGIEREAALKALAYRTGLEDIRGLVSLLVQTLKFGTSIGDTLRVYAEEFRDKRMQRAEELAAKIGTKLIFPLVFCLFPSFFIVAIGPAVVRIIDVFRFLGEKVPN
jgi:tight adherence protein C